MIDSLLRLILRFEGLHAHFLLTSLGRVRVYVSKRIKSAVPSVVLIHGIGCNAGHFYLLIPFLLSKFTRVIAVDLPGHGLSDDTTEPMTPELMYSGVVQSFDALMASGDLEPSFFVMGNSLGGAIALRYASEFPGRVRAVILTSPATGFEREKDWLVLVRVLRTNTARARHRFARAALDGSKWMLPLGLYLLKKAFARQSVRDLLKNSSFKDVNIPRGNPVYQGPALLVWGQEEKVFPRKNLDWLKSNLAPTATVLSPEGVGHCPHFDKPLWFARQMTAFAKRVSFQSGC